MVISGTRLLLNLRIAFHDKMNYATTTNGGTLTDTELTSFRARVPRSGRRRPWGLDTSMLTEAEPYGDDFHSRNVVKMDAFAIRDESSTVFSTHAY